MNRRFFKFFLLVSGFYFLASLIFSSSFVQNRILREIKVITTPAGVALDIENIDIALFPPKVYLNRVSLSTNSSSPIQIPKPLSIERVKIAIDPFKLLFGKVSLSEVSFYQPKIILENADVLYKKIEKLMGQKSKWQVKGSKFSIEVQKVGVVDAYVLVTLKESGVGVDSGRFTLFVEQSAKEQFTVSSNFTNLSLDRGKFHQVIKAADFDLDITQKSVRANRITLESDWLSLNIKGATALPIDFEKGPDSFRASYEIKANLEVLKQIEELKGQLPSEVLGHVSSEGNLEKNGRSYVGSGKIFSQNVIWAGYELGTGEVAFVADGKKAEFNDLLFQIESGKIKAPKITIEFKEKSPFQAELLFNDLDLNKLFKRLKIKRNPLYVLVNGQAKLKGNLGDSIAVEGEIDSQLDKMIVLAHPNEPISPTNTVISIESSKTVGKFSYQEGQGSFKTQTKILDGTLVAEGKWNKSIPLQINVDGTGLSLTKLGKIQDLPFGGATDLKAQVSVDEGEPTVVGQFDLKNGEIADVTLGSVKGKVVYQNDLLSFESLELPSLEMIKSEGFVDFKPKDTRYKFNISAKRASVDQVFQFFKKNALEFTPPQGGELSANVILEGGHDSKGIQVTARGNVRGIQWYKENWLGGSFSLVYRPEFVQISRATLTKPRGALGFNGFFRGHSSKLQIQSYGLKLEDLNQFQGSSISGEVVGQITLEGDIEKPTGQGELKVIKTFFRNQSLGDSNISLRESPEKSEFIGSLFDGSLKGRWVTFRTDKKANSDLLLNLQNCNITPLLSMWSAKDLPSFGAIVATGDVQLSGDFKKWNGINGSGTLAELKLDLKTAPVRNQKQISFVIDQGAVKVSPFELSGQDSVMSGFFEFSPNGPVRGALDAKLDLLYIQPFIPGLEYGTGKVTAGIRLSGTLPKFEMLGNVGIEDGTFRIQNLAEDFRNVRAQLGLTQEKITIERFESTHGGGNLQIKGGVLFDRFSRFSPELKLAARGIGFRQQNYLALKVSGDLELTGKNVPYTLSGKCNLDEGRLSDFNVGPTSAVSEEPTLKFDLNCHSEKKFVVDTEVMQAEWKGDFLLSGNNISPGLTGTADASKGIVFFKETKFNLVSGNVKFEDKNRIAPRFNVSAKSFVKEQRAQVPIEYEVTLSAYGTPQDYKIRLNSVPALSEPDLIALLVLGVTTRGQDDNYLDFGSTLVGKSPLQTKLQNEFGVNIKVNMQRNNTAPVASGGNTSTGSGGASGGNLTNPLDNSVPAVKIQKDITNRTKVSYSSTLDQNALKEFKIEQLLDENFTVNASAVDKFRGSTQNDSIKSYGLDFRYRFQFE